MSKSITIELVHQLGDTVYIRNRDGLVAKGTVIRILWKSNTDASVGFECESTQYVVNFDNGVSDTVATGRMYSTAEAAFK